MSTISKPLFLNKSTASSHDFFISGANPSTKYSLGIPIFLPLNLKFLKSLKFGILTFELVESQQKYKNKVELSFISLIETEVSLTEGTQIRSSISKTSILIIK